MILFILGKNILKLDNQLKKHNNLTIVTKLPECISSNKTSKYS